MHETATIESRWRTATISIGYTNLFNSNRRCPLTDTGVARRGRYTTDARRNDDGNQDNAAYYAHWLRYHSGHVTSAQSYQNTQRILKTV